MKIGSVEVLDKAPDSWGGGGGGGVRCGLKTLRLLRHGPHLPEFQARGGGQGLG